MPTYNMPQRREPKDPLDTILKGLNIAANIYGIKEAREKSDNLAKQTKLEEEKVAILKQQGQDSKDAKMKELLADEDKTTTEAFKVGTIREKDPTTGKWTHRRDPTYRPPSSADTEIRDLRKSILATQLADDQQKASFRKTTDGRVAALGAQEKQRLDNARLAFQTVGDMAQALKSGDNTFSMIGDNRFTLARTKFEEALGRMQSGGAISADEEARFKKMAPTALDSTKIQNLKLAELQKEFGQRLSTLGFSPEDFGLAYNTDQEPQGDGPQLNMHNTAGSVNVMGLPAANAGQSFVPDRQLVNDAQAEIIRRRGLKAAPLPKGKR